MPSNLTREEPQDLEPLLQALTALASGDFCQKLPDGLPGEMGEIARTVNGMVDQLNQFAAELTRLSREVGTEGWFGGQMEVPGAEGTWRDLVENVNHMSANLTHQVRNCVQVTRAYAGGDFTPRVTTGCQRETGELKNAINEIGERLRAG